MERTIKKINLVYYAVYTATILSTIIGYLLNLSSTGSVGPKSDMGIALASILIMYIIVSIPLSLRLFHKMTKKWRTIEDEALKFQKYENGAILRLVIIGIGLVSSVILFYVLRTESMIFCAGIAAIALLFCKPSEGKIVSDLKLDETED